MPQGPILRFYRRTDARYLFSATNTGVSQIYLSSPEAALKTHAELLWDETCRACDWLADNGYLDAPLRPKKTDAPDESQQEYRAVQRYLRAKLQATARGEDQSGNKRDKTPAVEAARIVEKPEAPGTLSEGVEIVPKVAPDPLGRLIHSLQALCKALADGPETHPVIRCIDERSSRKPADFPCAARLQPRQR